MIVRSSLVVALAIVTPACAVGPDTTSLDAELGKSCGNGRCTGRETCGNCPRDCGMCTPSDADAGAGGEDAGTLPGSVCGDGACEADEDCSSCAADCTCTGPTEEPLWYGDATTYGLDAWKGQQEPDDDDLDVVTDPAGLYGSVYRAQLEYGERYGGKARSEFYGALRPDDIEIVGADPATADHAQGRHADLFYGWRSRVNAGINAPDGRSNSGNLLQLKGDAECGGPAVGLTIKYGRVTLRTELDYGYDNNILWNGPPISELEGEWHDFVLHVHFSFGNDGFVEVWYDGVPQTLVNGDTRIYVPTMCPGDTRVRLKMGLYRSTELEQPGITDSHWIDSPRVGTSYGAVAPR